MSPHSAAVLLAVGLWPSVAALCQDSTRRDRRDSVIELPAIEVFGSILPIVGPAIGSGVPARVSVIEAQAVRSWKPRLLPNLLRREPGISLYDDLGSLAKTTMVFRGFTASPVVGLPQGISVFLDGVSVNEPDAGQVNFDVLPLDHIDRVEVLSGTASLLGPHSLGGAVNLVTRFGAGGSGGEVELSAGSHGTFGTTLSYRGDAPGGLRYYVGGGYAREGGWRQLTEARAFNGLVNIGRIGPHSGFRLQALIANGYAETAGSLPLSVYQVRPDSNLSAGDFEDVSQLHVAVSGYRPIGSGRGAATLYFRRNQAERFNVNQVNDPDVRNFSLNRTLGASADWRAARNLGRGTLNGRVGIGGSAHRAQVTIYGERIDPGLTTNIESPIARFDAFGLADFTVGRVTLSGGVRYDLVRVPFQNRIDPARDTTSTFQRLSPRGGVSVAVGRSASLYASAGQSFRPPALIELACADPAEPCPLPFALGDDPPLAPVVATAWEAGGRWLVGALALSGSAYRTDVRDDIFLFPYDDATGPAGSTIDGYFANLTQTRREGVELGARLEHGRLALYGNHAWTRATFQVDAVEIFSIRDEAGGENIVERGDRFPLVPAHVFSFGAAAALPRGVSLGLDGRYTGSRFLRGDEANDEEPLDGYWLLDLRAGVGFGDWEVEAIARNVLDAGHATFGTFNLNQGAGDALERFLTPGTPRTIQLVVRRGFGSR